MTENSDEIEYFEQLAEQSEEIHAEQYDRYLRERDSQQRVLPEPPQTAAMPPAVPPAAAAGPERPVVEVKTLDPVVLAPTIFANLASWPQAPRIFVRDDAIVEVREKRGRTRIVELDAKSLRTRIAERMRCVRTGDDGVYRNVRLPDDVISYLLTTHPKPLPELRGVILAPTFTREGEAVLAPGWDPTTGLYLAGGGWNRMRAVPREPTEEDLRRAVHLIYDSLLGEFQFVHPSDHANAFAATLQPFARELIRGPTPLFAVLANVPMTGKSVLCEAIAYPAIGHPVQKLRGCRSDDEYEKKLSSYLQHLPPVLCLDNVADRLDSSFIAMALTTETLGTRVLGKSVVMHIDNRALWLCNGNNLEFSVEVRRRTAPIRLEMRYPPRQFSKDIKEWAATHRNELVWACMTIIQAWVASGRQPGTKRLESFEGWSATMSGVLDTAGINGFLDNVSEFRDNPDHETLQLEAFLANGRAWFGDRWVPFSELEQFLRGVGMFAVRIEGKPPASATAILSKMLARMERVAAGGIRLLRRRDRGQHSTDWKFELVGGASGPRPPDTHER